MLELLTVCVIIAILILLTMPALEGVRKRTEKVRCFGNLRNLYIGANGYVQQYGQWPQIPTTGMQTDPKPYYRSWVQALEPFGIPHSCWICPTVQRSNGNAGFDSNKDYRNDYLAMPFDDKPMTPYRWTKAPWFVEKSDVHSNGQLIIFTDGSTIELKELVPK